MSRILMTTDARPGIWGFSTGLVIALGWPRPWDHAGKLRVATEPRPGSGAGGGHGRGATLPKANRAGMEAHRE